MNPCALSDATIANGVKIWLCSECGGVKSGVRAVDISIRTSRPPKYPMNIVFKPIIGIAQRAFLNELGKEDVERDLYLGRIFNHNGKECGEYATFKGRHTVIVRGVEDYGYRTCPACGHHYYYAKYSQKQSYLYPDPSEDAEIFESHSGSLVVTERIYLRIAEIWRRRIYVTKLNVLEMPLDGLFELRSVYSDRTQ